MIKAIAAVALHRQPECRIERAHRAGEHGAIGMLVVVSGIEFGSAPERVGRVGALHVDEPGQRIGAIQGALRPAQNFDPIDVKQRGGGA